jgi:hypothetical protein
MTNANIYKDLWTPCRSEGDAYDARQARRTEWFDKIAPKANWKNPIDATIARRDFLHCNAACIWFTGAPLTIVEEEPWGGPVRVTAPGYYATIGA